MPYYDTIEDDLARAKQILAEGKPDEASLSALPATIRSEAGGTIFGKDIYAAYKLLESFVAEIERLAPLEHDNAAHTELHSAQEQAIITLSLKVQELEREVARLLKLTMLSPQVPGVRELVLSLAKHQHWNGAAMGWVKVDELLARLT